MGSFRGGIRIFRSQDVKIEARPSFLEKTYPIKNIKIPLVNPLFKSVSCVPPPYGGGVINNHISRKPPHSNHVTSKFAYWGDFGMLTPNLLADTFQIPHSQAHIMEENW